MPMSRDRELARAIAREHTEVHRRVDEVQREVERLGAESGPAHTPGGLHTLLASLAEHLQQHFELEERGGFLGGHGAQHTGTQRVVDDLVAQHRDFESRIATLLDGAERADTSQTSLSDAFVEGLQQFITDLLAHEHRENELIQELIGRDVGTGD